MTDLSVMSDSDLLAALKNAPDIPAMVTAEAQKQGVDPSLALSVAHAESGFDPSAVSSKGAVGPMQLMPETAKELGVDPTDPAQNIQGGVTYLKQQLDRFGQTPFAVAAYNAGPGAVEKAGGVPDIPETQAYVSKVMGNAGVGQMSDADLMRALGIDAPAAAPAAVPAAAPATQPAHAAPAARAMGVPMAQRVAPAPAAPSLWDQAVEGVKAPLRTLKNDIEASYAKSTARATAPLPNPVQAIMGTAGDIGDAARNVGDALGVLGAPIQGLLHPAAIAIAKAPLTPYAAPKLGIANGRPTLSAPQPINGQDRVNMIQGALNTALSAVPATPKAIATANPMTVEQVRAAKNAAYAAVDQSGFRLPGADVQQTALDIANEVARKGGPSAAKLYPAAKAMSERLTALAEQPGGVPLTQLDELRGDIYGALVKPGDRESPIGVMMRGKIDDLINSANAPDIAKARDLNTRLMKMQAVTDKLDSAGLRSASTYSGGNYNNAVRQNLRPLVDPTSAQQIGNLTPAEEAALRKAVTGTPGQNATRYATKILTNKMVQAPVALMTHGAGPAIMEAVGTILNKVGQGQTQKAVQRALDLMSMGGRPAAQAPIPALQMAGQPALPLFSPRGLFGGSVLLSNGAQAAAPARAR